MKKLFVLSLFILLTLAFTITTLAFEDMPYDWSKAALESAVENGLLTGDGNLLKPRDSLTRAQMAAIVTRAFNAKNEGDISSFVDIPENAWYRDEMAKAYYMNVFRGDGAGHMNPENPVSREEAFVVLARALSLENGNESALDAFDDASLVSSWARAPISAMVENGYVNGSNGALNPRGNITRAEFAQLMYNLVALYIDTPEDIAKLPDREGNVILRANIPLEELDFSRDLIIADGVEGEIVFKNVTVQKRLVVRAFVDFTFEGRADTLVSDVDNLKVTLHKDTEIKTVLLTGDNATTYIPNESENTPTQPSTPTPTPPSDNEDEEEIWTDFH